MNEITLFLISSILQYLKPDIFVFTTRIQIEDENVHVLDKEDKWFERRVKEAINVKLEQRKYVFSLRHATYNAVLKTLRRQET